MLLFFVNKSSNVWKRGVHSVYRACLSWTFYEFMCVLLSILVLKEGCAI